MPRVADNSTRDQDAVIGRLIKKFVWILVVAMNGPARAIAIRDEVVLAEVLEASSD